MRYISTVEAIGLHILLMTSWRETRFGVDRKDLLESALNRPRQAAAFANAGIAEQAATLCYGLVKNHPLHGGNKRTATFLMETFIDVNGFSLDRTDVELADLALKIDLGKTDVSGLTEWLEKRIGLV